MKVFKSISILVFIFFLGCKNTSSQQMELLTPEKINSLLVKNKFKASNGLEIPYRLFSSENSNDQQKPLVVFLHGRGDRGVDNGSQTYHEAGIITNENSLLTEKMQEKYPCYILVPQCSNKTENEEWAKWVGNSPETPFKGLTKNGSYVMNEQPSESGAATLELIRKTIKTHNIDPNRIYIIGVSMGGFGTWEFIAREPKLFAAAVPMAGYSDPSQIKNIQHIPIWIFHGNTDKWNPVEGSRTMYKLLNEKKADIRYTEYDDTGHAEAFQKAFTETELLPWLFSKSKKDL